MTWVVTAKIRFIQPWRQGPRSRTGRTTFAPNGGRSAQVGRRGGASADPVGEGPADEGGHGHDGEDHGIRTGDGGDGDGCGRARGVADLQGRTDEALLSRR